MLVADDARIAIREAEGKSSKSSKLVPMRAEMRVCVYAGETTRRRRWPSATATAAAGQD